MITNKTKLNMVIGYPLTHSQSPFLHNRLYEKLGIDAVLLAVPSVHLGLMIHIIKTARVGLTSVTMPFKQSIMRFMDKVDAQAKRINAVNTVINKNGKLYGFNTDIDGVTFALKTVPIKNKNVLLFGAGGASRAVAYFLKKNKANIFYVNRTRSKALSLQKEFGGKAVNLNRLSPYFIDVIINATSIGMNPKIKETPLPIKFLRKEHVVFDVVYNRSLTELLKQAKKTGAKIIEGREMFLGQALKQIELYTGRKINKKFKLYASKILI